MDSNRHSASPRRRYKGQVEVALVLLARLKSVHEELLAALSGLEALLGAEPPDPNALASVRQHLRQYSAARTVLLQDEVYPHILKDAAPAEAAAIDGLRAEAARFRPISDMHVAMWTSDRIMRTWPKYCSASASMRTSMRRRVEAERSALYPMLEARASGTRD